MLIRKNINNDVSKGFPIRLARLKPAQHALFKEQHTVLRLNWSAMKKIIRIGSLSGLNFAIRGAAMDHSLINLGELL